MPEISRSQSVTLSWGANIKYAPLAFTEHGAVVAASLIARRHRTREWGYC
jgi:hypothetical protein